MLYDTHAHLCDAAFASDQEAVIGRALAAGVGRIICIGTDLDSSRACLALADRHEAVYAAVGWHPSDADGAPDDLRPALRELGAHRKVVALGETGLDYTRLPSTQPGGTPAEDAACKQKQAALFRQHLEVAEELGLNCVVHQRDSFADALALVAPFAGRVRGVFHCFAGDPQELGRVLDLGGLVSFTGLLTFKNARNVRDALAAAPMDRFMLETDCPYLAPTPFRGKRCEPSYLIETARAAAAVKGCSGEEVSAVTSRTADDFFFRPRKPR